MKATERTLQQILHSAEQYVIPVFQRYYSWGKKDWEQLWEDLLLLQETDEEKRRHFLGSIVCVPEKHMPGVISAYQVIDGQQRLMTLSILLCALRTAAKKKGWEELAAEIEENYLIHKFKKNRERYKVYPRIRDREYYLTLVDGGESEKNIRLDLTYLVGSAYIYFLEQIEGKEGLLESEETLRKLFVTLTAQLDFVLIVLDGENPYKIFKSLNSTGVDLGQGDLIRNHVFMAVSINYQDAFDDNYWRPLEKHFEEGGKLNGSLFASFFRDLLMSEGNYVVENAVYEAFEKKYPLSQIEPLNLISDLKCQAKHYDLIRGGSSHANSQVNQALQALRNLNITTSYPLLLALLSLYEKQQLTDKELVEALQTISGFVLRRYICGESSRGYNRLFCTACRELKDKPLVNLKKYLKGRGWPSNELFIPAFQRTKLYTGNYALAVLQGLELALQEDSEPVLLHNCQIEHVMPQTIADDTNGNTWKKALGDDWRRIHTEWLHTPGNLTLIGDDYNNDMKNKPFEEKQPTLRRSKVYLNQYFAPLDLITWDEQEITKRAQELAQIAARVWVGPL